MKIIKLWNIKSENIIWCNVDIRVKTSLQKPLYHVSKWFWRSYLQYLFEFNGYHPNRTLMFIFKFIIIKIIIDLLYTLIISNLFIIITLINFYLQCYYNYKLCPLWYNLLSFNRLYLDLLLMKFLNRYKERFILISSMFTILQFCWSFFSGLRS